MAERTHSSYEIKLRERNLQEQSPFLKRVFAQRQHCAEEMGCRRFESAGAF
jgi:hypothetical protein